MQADMDQIKNSSRVLKETEYVSSKYPFVYCIQKREKAESRKEKNGRE